MPTDIRVDGRGLLQLGEPARDRGARGARRSAPAAGARRARRQYGAAPAGVVGRGAQAEAHRFRRWPASSGCFGKQALANFVKGLIKLVVLGAVHDRAAVAGAPPARRHGADRSVGTLGVTTALSLKLIGAVVAMLAVVAAADYCSSTGNGSSGRRCRCRRSRRSSSRPKAIPHIKGKMRQLRQPACASA